ncbi:MAG: sugar phosphate isomerase/epimerase [Thermofilaceae archaeon]|nr:sugar phosphate isomerase/epimerase [Thermofilaceae archaeon]MCX8180941.1 sugar phosphate isomerase/epimerase [Thermofilaceae archaeon]MDW8004046.1 sugar phosphate isomerase/epimerase [Thermofilaceae archaeon]
MRKVKICLAWLYAITKYGYPTPVDLMFRVFEDAARLGFTYVEVEAVGSRNLNEIAERKRELKAKLNELGLEIVNFAGIFSELISPFESERERAFESMRKAADLAVYFGAELLQTDTYTPPLEFIGPRPYSSAVVFAERYRVKVSPTFSWRSFWSLLVESMRGTARIAADYGLKLVVEPRVGETISNSDAMLRLIDEVSEDNFGAVLDVGHLHASKELLPLTVEKLDGRIFYVHASDNDGRDNYHWAVGRGTVDWRGLFEALLKHHFSGPIAVDVGGPDIAHRLEEDVITSKKILEELVNEYLSQ